jgi:hypothetical protein
VHKGYQNTVFFPLAHGSPCPEVSTPILAECGEHIRELLAFITIKRIRVRALQPTWDIPTVITHAQIKDGLKQVVEEADTEEPDEQGWQ